jgi:Leucine-rich repeat (LRR) protein
LVIFAKVVSESSAEPSQDSKAISSAAIESLKGRFPNLVVTPSPADGRPLVVKLQQVRLDQTAFQELASIAGLEEIGFEKSDFEEEWLQNLASLTSLKRLRLAGTKVSDRGLKVLGQVVSLELLDLADCQSVTDQGVAHLASLTRLKNLALGSRAITDEGLSSISSLQNLGALSLQNCAIQGPGLSTIAGLKKLKEFGLNQSSAGDIALENLRECPEIAKLKLRGSGVSSQEVQKWIQSFAKLSSLDLGETSIDDKAVESIAKCPKLEDLNLLRCQVTSQGIAPLTNLRLKRLNLDDIRGIDDAVFDSLVKMELLEFLHLGKTQITDRGLLRLVSLAQLKDLIINDTAISESAKTDLKKALPNLKIR